MPPWIWPSTSVGLIARPTSCAATMRQHLHRAELEVDLDLGDLRAEAVGRVGHALPVGVERRGRRVEGRLAPQHAAVAVGRQVASVDARARSPSRDRPAPRRRAPASRPGRHWRGAGSARAGRGRRARPRCRRRRSGARPRSCRRRRSDRCRRHQRRSARPAAPSASAAIWAMTVLRALADVDRALVQHDACRRRRARPRWSTGWAARCCRCRTTCRRCRRRAARGPPRRVERRRLRPRARASAAAAPRGRRRARRLRRAPGRSPSRRRPAARCDARNSSRSMPSCVGELVDQRLVGDRRLRHAEAAEGAGRRRRWCRSPGSCAARAARAYGPDGVHRHAVGDGRPPRGIGAGVEVAVEVDGR